MKSAENLGMALPPHLDKIQKDGSFFLRIPYLITFHVIKENIDGFYQYMNTIWQTISILGTDDDDVIVRSFEAFEINGQIDAEM